MNDEHWLGWEQQERRAEDWLELDPEDWLERDPEDCLELDPDCLPSSLAPGKDICPTMTGTRMVDIMRRTGTREDRVEGSKDLSLFSNKC